MTKHIHIHLPPVARVRTADATWEESKHKRDDSGKFGSGGGGAAKKSSAPAAPNLSGPKAQTAIKAIQAAAAKGDWRAVANVNTLGTHPQVTAYRNAMAEHLDAGGKALSEAVGKPGAKPAMKVDPISHRTSMSPAPKSSNEAPMTKERAEANAQHHAGLYHSTKDPEAKAHHKAEFQRWKAKAAEHGKQPDPKTTPAKGFPASGGGTKPAATSASWPKNEHGNHAPPVGTKVTNPNVGMDGPGVVRSVVGNIAKVAYKVKGPDGKVYNRLEDFHVTKVYPVQ